MQQPGRRGDTSILEATAIIVNYRSEAHVAELLTGLHHGGNECPEQIVVVDNSPERGLAERTELTDANATYLPMDANIGFTAAVNRGLREANRRFVVLLNPDARPRPGCLSGLIDVLDDVHAAAIAGPRLIPFHAGDPEVPSATLTDPGFRSVMLEYTVARRLIPRSRDWLQQHYFARPADAGLPMAVAMVQGACFAFVREWVGRVGEFDASRFFLYWEETDFCRRVRDKGGEVLYCPQLECRHLGGASITDEADAERHFWRGFHAYMEKHHGCIYSRLMRVMLFLGVGAEYLVLRTLGFFRRGGDRKLDADTETMRLRLHGQLGTPER